MKRRLLILLVAAALVSAAGACGRKGDLEPPPEKDGPAAVKGAS